MRIRTTPLYNEIASSGNSTPHSPLNRFLDTLESKYNIQLDQLEKRQQHIVPPWWIPLYTYINESPDAAVEQHDATEPTALRIYSLCARDIQIHSEYRDGTSHTRTLKASNIQMHQILERRLGLYISSTCTRNVFLATNDPLWPCMIS
jgi:hypothetical protein